jgi:hypothetical protein
LASFEFTSFSTAKRKAISALLPRWDPADAGASSVVFQTPWVNTVALTIS